MKSILFFILFTTSLFASLEGKSAIFYYAKGISYPMVGIHNYIVVDPDNIDETKYGFELYNAKIYARIESLDVNDLIQQGYKNFYIDKHLSEEELIGFSQKYSSSKLMIRADIPLIKRAHRSVRAVIFEGDSPSDDYLDLLKAYNIDAIEIEHTTNNHLKDISKKVLKIEQRGVIPYIADDDFSFYGVSSKNALKREIFTLIDERVYNKRLQSAHRHGAVIFEYMGYIQKFHSVDKPLPSVAKMQQYAGVVIWLQDYYEKPSKIISWVKKLINSGMKVVFLNNFGGDIEDGSLAELGISLQSRLKERSKILTQDKMVGFEIRPTLSASYIQVKSKNEKVLLAYENVDKTVSVPAAITSWGGYAVSEAYMSGLNDNSMWVIDPFTFFKMALRLEEIPVADTTTANGNRLFLTHSSSDGFSNIYEGDRKSLAAEMAFEKIIKQYDLLHSFALKSKDIEGSSKKEKQILRDILDNDKVEEIDINAMQEGYTTIVNRAPWLSNISAQAVEENGTIEVYTAIQSENSYTNYWSGPFWGYKSAIQTFKLTNSPRRLKPIAIYYHMYACSKEASLKSLLSVFDWAMKQNIFPIFASEYIKKVKEYYAVSMAKEGKEFLVDGMRNLKTLRLERGDAHINLEKSSTVAGVKHFEDHTYLSLDQHRKHFVTLDDSYEMSNYLLDANADLKYHKFYKGRRQMLFEGILDLKINLSVNDSCKVSSRPKESRRVKGENEIYLEYQHENRAIVNINCKVQK